MLDLANFILSQGHEVTIISSNDAIPPVSVRTFKPSSTLSLGDFVLNSTPIRQSASSLVRSGLLFVSTIIATVNGCRKQETSIIHAQDSFYAGFAGVVAHKLYGIPLIVHFHGPSPYFSSSTSETTKFRKKMVQLLARFVTRHSNLVIVTDNQTKKLVSTFAGSVEILCIPTPILVSAYSKKSGDAKKWREDANAGKRGLIFGTVGRLAPQKNLQFLLKVFASAKNDLFNSKLIVVGDGPDRSILTNEASELGLGNAVEFVGTVSEQEKIELLKSFDIFIMPSVYEGCPIALLEAMACGKAIITSDIPAMREIARPEEEAILINPRREDELRQAILRLFNQPDMRAILGKKAKERSELYDVNPVFHRLMGLYENLSQ